MPSGTSWPPTARSGRSASTASRRYLEKLYDHVVSQDKSAREALQTFLAGRGDVLLAYENEAIFAQKQDQPLDYVIPKATIADREPDRGHEDEPNKRPPAPSSASCARNRLR